MMLFMRVILKEQVRHDVAPEYTRLETHIKTAKTVVRVSFVDLTIVLCYNLSYRLIGGYFYEP